jgi:hypothetical protein
MKWVTRERVRMDRVACAWLITNFIDGSAEFHFLTQQDLERAPSEIDGIPFVVPGAELSRQGERITFDVMLEKYKLTDPALLRLADIVRVADIRGLTLEVPEAAGLRAIVHGVFLMKLPDEEALKRQYPLFDGLYRYCQEQVKKES